jgi:hypothetical protein
MIAGVSAKTQNEHLPNTNLLYYHYTVLLVRIRCGLISFGFIKKTTSYGIERMYLLHTFPFSSKHL